MKKRCFIDQITVRLSSQQRKTLDRLSLEEDKGLGEVTREILDLGLRARGLEV